MLQGSSASSYNCSDHLRSSYPSLKDIYDTRVTRRAHSIILDRTHTQHSLFKLLPSGRCYRSVKLRTTWLRKSFYPSDLSWLFRHCVIFDFLSWLTVSWNVHMIYSLTGHCRCKPVQQVNMCVGSPLNRGCPIPTTVLVKKKLLHAILRVLIQISV